MIEYGNAFTAEEYNALRQDAGWGSCEAEQTALSLQGSLRLFSARENGRLVGMGRMIGDGGYVMLVSDIIVLQTHRHQGIASELLRRMLAFAAEGLKPGQSRFINLMAAKGAEALYQRFGFVARPNERQGAGMGLWIRV